MWLFFLLLVFSFLLLNFGNSILFGGRFFDATADKRLSLRPETKEFLAEMKTPVTVRLYLSPAMEKDYPQLWQYSKALIEFLKKYQLFSDGMVGYEVQKTEPYSAAAKEADRLGIKHFYGTDGRNMFYFGGLVMADRGDGYVIPAFVPLRRNYLESDLNRILFNLNSDRKPLKIGVMLPHYRSDVSSQKIILPENAGNFLRQLTNDYVLVQISPQAVQIGVDIDTLIVVLPDEGLPPTGVYALDQFVLRGGNLILLTDALNEHTNRIPDMEGVAQLLKNWGIEIERDVVAGDRKNAEEILSGGRVLLYYPQINLPAEQLNRSHPISRSANSLIFQSPAILKTEPKEGLKTTVLASTSAEGGHVSAGTARLPDKFSVLQAYEDDGLAYNLAVLTEGTFRSLFKKNILDGTKYSEQMLTFLPESLKPGKVLVIGDTDFIYDDVWSDAEYVRDNPVWGIVPWADNGDFILRAVDYMTGGVQYLQNSHRAFLPEVSLEGVFREKVSANHREDYFNLLQRLREKEELLESLHEEQDKGFTLEKMRLLEETGKEAAQLEKQIREYDYKTEQGVWVLKVMFAAGVFVSSIVLSVFLLFILRRRRLAERYRNPLEENHE